jgi:hypothetical protein
MEDMNRAEHGISLSDAAATRARSNNKCFQETALPTGQSGPAIKTQRRIAAAKACSVLSHGH